MTEQEAELRECDRQSYDWARLQDAARLGLALRKLVLKLWPIFDPERLSDKTVPAAVEHTLKQAVEQLTGKSLGWPGQRVPLPNDKTGAERERELMLSVRQLVSVNREMRRTFFRATDFLDGLDDAAAYGGSEFNAVHGSMTAWCASGGPFSHRGKDARAVARLVRWFGFKPAHAESALAQRRGRRIVAEVHALIEDKQAQPARPKSAPPPPTPSQVDLEEVIAAKAAPVKPKKPRAKKAPTAATPSRVDDRDDGHDDVLRFAPDGGQLQLLEVRAAHGNASAEQLAELAQIHDGTRCTLCACLVDDHAGDCPASASPAPVLA